MVFALIDEFRSAEIAPHSENDCGLGTIPHKKLIDASMHAKIGIYHAAKEFGRIVMIFARVVHDQIFFVSVERYTIPSTPCVHAVATYTQLRVDLVQRLESIEQLEDIQIVGKRCLLATERARRNSNIFEKNVP